MTTIDRTHTEHTAITLVIANYLETAAARIRDGYIWRKAFNQTRRELSILADYELHDLGISRWDIERISAEAAQDALNKVAAAR